MKLKWKMMLFGAVVAAYIAFIGYAVNSSFLSRGSDADAGQLGFERCDKIYDEQGKRICTDSRIPFTHLVDIEISGTRLKVPVGYLRWQELDDDYDGISPFSWSHVILRFWMPSGRHFAGLDVSYYPSGKKEQGPLQPDDEYLVEIEVQGAFDPEGAIAKRQEIRSMAERVSSSKWPDLQIAVNGTLLEIGRRKVTVEHYSSDFVGVLESKNIYIHCLFKEKEEKGACNGPFFISPTNSYGWVRMKYANISDWRSILDAVNAKLNHWKSLADDA